MSLLSKSCVNLYGFENRNNGGNVNTRRLTLIHSAYVNQYSIYAVMTRSGTVEIK